MDHRLIEPGMEYGYREKPSARGPLEHVRALERVRGQWRVEWIEPNPGLQAFVKSANIVVPWKQRRAFLKEEADRQTLREASEATWPGYEHPVVDAVSTVLESTGEQIWCAQCGILNADPDVLERIGQRIGIAIEVRQPGFVDRNGRAHLPFAEALKIAQAFSRSDPEAVLTQVESEEADAERRSRESYGSRELDRLEHRYLASRALVRQWTGFDAARTESRKEVERLRRVIRDFELTLRRAGHDELAAQLERKSR